MPYIHFTEDQKLRANSVDLVEFLRRQGEKLISSGQDKRLTSDHSITVHGNEWYDHAAERGGHAISFVQNFYGLTYPEAVTRLLNGEQGEVYIPAEKKEKEPQKPQKNGKTQGISLCSRIYGSCGRRSGRTGRRLLRMGLGTALYGRS